MKDQTKISEATKKIVMERQRGLSITGMWLGRGVNYHHCITSGLGEKGVGYEWNVVALTPEEHRLYHDKAEHIGRYTFQEFETLMFNHLKIKYPMWSKDKCKVKKGYEEKDYGVYQCKLRK